MIASAQRALGASISQITFLSRASNSIDIFSSSVVASVAGVSFWEQSNQAAGGGEGQNDLGKKTSLSVFSAAALKSRRAASSLATGLRNAFESRAASARRAMPTSLSQASKSRMLSRFTRSTARCSQIECRSESNQRQSRNGWDQRSRKTIDHRNGVASRLVTGRTVTARGGNPRALIPAAGYAVLGRGPRNPRTLITGSGAGLAISCGGGAAAARLAHNQEVIGASPIPATSSGDGLGIQQPGSMTWGGFFTATDPSGRADDSAKCPRRAA